MKRRGFLKTGALLAAYSLLWGCRSVAGSSGSDSKRGTILVIGAGIAGLAAAKDLQSQGYEVTILEGRNRIGGRIWTDHSWPNAHLDLGASWIHGVKGNPISKLANDLQIDTLSTDYDSYVLYNTDGRRLSGGETERVDEQFWLAAEAVEEIGEELDNDISIGRALELALQDVDLSKQELRELNYAVNTTIEHEYAADVAEMSLFNFGKEDEFGGGDVLFPGGYDQIVNGLAKGLDIKLNQRVEQIAYDDSGVTVTTSTDEFTADWAVITLPLGVLKQRSVQFAPKLPSWKQAAIDRLGMGVLNKTYLQFEQVFWPNKPHLLGYISREKGEWAEFLNIHRYTGLPILLGFNAATYGRQIEQMSDNEIVASAMVTLRRIFGADIPAPTARLITRWASDPFAGGSYSFVAAGAGFDDYKAMAKPVAKRLFFAGEATHHRYPATVQGAFLSGIREAERIAEL